MPQFEYNYDTPPRSVKSVWHGRLRRIGLFIVVAAVTAGALYLLYPGSDGKPKGGTPPSSEKIEQPDAGSEASATGKDAAAPRNADGEKLSQLPANDSGNDELPSDESPDTATDGAAAQQQPTAEPEKGKVWAGDPVIDQPTQAVPPSERGESQRNLADYRAKKLVNGAIIYSVKSGDFLERIARKHHTTIDALVDANGLESAKSTIRIGQKLYLLPGPWEIEVSKSARVLKLYNLNSGKSRLFAEFDIGIGRQGSTPADRFQVRARIESPSWTAPDGSIYKHGDPDNPLGDYFLKLGYANRPAKPANGIGIHGTNDESSVTRSLSSGCIRMRRADIKMLYELTPVSTPVRITE
ncbi:MAG: L,D-transpeptidase family protein [Victivallaceae bacterium]|nr:L,D-transpeptidase family protein [Victivallaceae bacterium]